MSGLNEEPASDSRDAALAEEKKNVLDNLKASNQLLRHQAITIVLFCVIALGLMELAQTQVEQDKEIYEKISVLEGLRDATDLQIYAEQHSHEIHMALMHTIDVDALYFRLSKTSFADRTPIVEAISELKQQRRGIKHISESTIGILGVSIPIGSWFYLIPLVIFLLFHNFTELVHYRMELLSIYPSSMEDWNQGPPLLGFRDKRTVTSSSMYLRYVSTLLAGGFLLLPLFTSFFFIMASYSLTPDYNRASGDLILGFNWLCLLVTLIDVIIVLHQENVLYFRSLVNFFSGGGNPVGFWRAVLWCAIPLMMFLLHYYTEQEYDTEQRLVAIYLFAATSMSSLLPISLFLLSRHPNNSLTRALVLVGLIVTLFWLSIPPLIWSGYLNYSHADPQEIAHLSIVVLAGAVMLSVLYVKLIWVRNRA